MRLRASRLKRRLLPTLGRPTMATMRFMKNQGLAFRRLHKTFDAVAGVDQLLVTRRETGAHVAAAIFAKRHFVEPRRRHARKRVERAARRVTREAGFVEAAGDKIAAAAVLLAHLEHA